MRELDGRRRGSRSLLVLGWHNVDGTWAFPAAPGRGRRGFEQQLRLIASSRSVVPLGQAVRWLQEGHPLPARATALTFDDGYSDNLTFVKPLLERLQLSATFFLVPEFLTGGAVPWWERLAWAVHASPHDTVTWRSAVLRLCSLHRQATVTTLLEQLKECDEATRRDAVDHLVDLLEPTGRPHVGSLVLDVTQARELASSPALEVGSHSLRHAILSAETGPAQREDLVLSRQALRDLLDVEPTLLAYPNGRHRDYDRNTLAAAELAGFSAAVTTVAGWNDAATPPLELRRFVMAPELGVKAFAEVARAGVAAARVRLRSDART